MDTIALPEDLDRDLETKPLAQALREATWGAHHRAEHNPFEKALAGGTLPVAAYRDLLAQTHAVYVALEEVAAEVAGDPLAGRVVFPELTRVPAIEADLAYYFGPDWRDEIEILPITLDYCDRIRKIAANEPMRYIAHHYTRYLADLSGGFVIDRAIKEAYGLDLDGRRYYQFDEISDPKAFKVNYREVLNGLPVDLEAKRVLVHEVLVAYEFNVAMIGLLGHRHHVA
jgi:heme oxygenase (biliverdin-producing, ferredoxin)